VDNDEQRNKPRQRRDTSAHVSAQKLLAQALKWNNNNRNVATAKLDASGNPVMADESAPFAIRISSTNFAF
jgi:hypothetical protein